MRGKCVSLLLSVLLLSGAVMAQESTASVTGRITDTSRAALPGATIQVRNVDTNEVRTVHSNSSGEYTVSELPVGVYEVTINAPGFKQLREDKLELAVGQSARVDAQLQIGTVNETVQVSAEVPLINTENFSRGDVISPHEMEQIPLNGRDFNDLAFTVAGVQPAEQHGKGAPYVTNGARADATSFLINGINDESPRDAGSQAQPPLDSLQEFKMDTSGYSAEYGRLAGGVINMALKTGGNQLHGSLFEFVRNDMFDATNFFGGSNKLRRNQFGGTLTGPIDIPKIYNGHDRTFFVVSWESYRQVQGGNNIGLVPTAPEIQGNFQGIVPFLKDPLSTKPCKKAGDPGCFPNNTIPQNRISPIAQAIAMKYYPCGANPTNCTTPGLSTGNNFQSSADTGDNWDDFVFKIDQKLTEKDNLSAFMLDRWEQSTNPFAGSPLGNFGARTDIGQSLYGISETRLFSPTLINDFHVGLTRTTDAELANDAGTDFASQFGIAGTTADPALAGFPSFKITGYEGLGDNSSDPIRFTVNDFDYNDVVTWIKGKHSIKFGGDVLHVQYYQPTNTNFNGTFSFKGKFTNDAFADFLLGFPDSTSRKVGTVTNHIRNTDYGVFFNDDYKIVPNLTLNLGLRYEISTAPNEENGQEAAFVPQFGQLIISNASTVPNLSSIVSTAGLTGLVGVSSNVGLPESLIHTRYNNFAPRVGFAWRPLGNNKTVVRGGYGIFYTGSRLTALRTDFFGGFPFSLTQTFQGSTSSPNSLTLANDFPAALTKLQGVTTTQGYDVNAATPYLESYNLTVEREMFKDVTLEAGYSGSRGDHLGRKYDLNQANHATGARPFAGYGDIEFYLFEGISNYNAATVSLRKRFQNGLMFRANYTFGKSLDDNSGLNYAGSGGYQGAQNSQFLAGEYGRSDFDIRHVFNMDFVYLLPLHNKLLRGFQLAGSGTVYSGQPFTPQLSVPTQDLGQATRPNRIGPGTLPNPSPLDWFNLNDFQNIPITALTFGNSGRDILDGPGSLAFNLALSKFFYITERQSLQFRWEVFNATNHVNLNLPNDNIDQKSAGTITSAGDPRIMQLGLRYQF